jgi:hypothetical protein
MTFSPDIGLWSPFMFWFIVVNIIATTLFTVVVIIGGFSDLRFLLRALREETPDETDDGRVHLSSDNQRS